MFKRLKLIVIIGLLGISCIGCISKNKVSLRDTVRKLQDSGAVSLENSDISIEFIGNQDDLEFAKEGNILYDTDNNLIGDTYIGISDIDIFKSIKEDRYLISDINGNNICVTLADKEPECPKDKVAIKMN